MQRDRTDMLTQLDARTPAPAWPAIAAGLLLLLSVDAQAQNPGPELRHPTHDLTVGANFFLYRNFISATPPLPGQIALDVAYHHTLDAAGRKELLRLTAGMRVGLLGGASVPLEGYGRAQLVAPFGAWKPSIGPEVGVTGFTRSMRLYEGTGYPDAVIDLVEARMSPVYVALSASPLRFQFNRFTFSAAEVQVGTTVPRLTSALRIQLGILHLGGSL